MATLPQGARIERVEPLAEGVARIRLAWLPGASLDFKAGQWTILQGGGGKRCFSIASPPSDRAGLTYLVERSGAGGLSDWLHACKGGEPVEVRGPHGKFVVEAETPPPVLLVGFDTGISPVLSIVRSRPGIRALFGWGLSGKAPDLGTGMETAPARQVLERLPALAREGGFARIYLAGRLRYLDPAKRILAEAGFPPDRVVEEPYDKPKG